MEVRENIAIEHLRGLEDKRINGKGIGDVGCKDIVNYSDEHENV